MFHKHTLLMLVLTLFGTFPSNFSTPKIVKMADPIPSWNTFLGGSDSDHATELIVDDDGNMYVVGSSASSWGEPISPFIPYCCGSSYLAKLDSSGNLIWNTFLGVLTNGRDISLDGAGNIYVVGEASTTWGNPVHPFSPMDYDNAFVAKLDPDGNLLWNTFLGDNEQTDGFNITVAPNGVTYITGHSYGTWGTPLRTFTGTQGDAFVAKLDASGNLVWNTFLGSNSSDSGYGIEMDGSGNVYAVGLSQSSWGNPRRAFRGVYDSFVAKLTSSGTMVWNTFLDLGMYGNANMSQIAVDVSGNSYIAGSYGWNSNDAHLTKLDMDGYFVWRTNLGTSAHDDYGYDVAVDNNGNSYISGSSKSTWGNPVHAFNTNNNANGFIAKLTADGKLAGSTFMDHGVGGITIDQDENIYGVGYSATTWGNPVRPYTDNGDGFVTKVALHIISGNTEIPDVTLSYTDGSVKTVQTDLDGDYSFGVSDNWTGTVTASDSTHTFTPASRDYVNVLTNQLDQNYAAIAFTVSGNVGIPGATLTYDDGGIQTTTSDQNGNYSFMVSRNWTGIITPSKTGYNFFPPNRQYANLIGDQLNQNYSILGRKTISAGESHTCGIKTDGSVWCWGNQYAYKNMPTSGSFAQIAAGAIHTCAIKTDGTLTCWGNNQYGQASPPAGTFTQLSTSYLHNCAIRTDGTVACWGEAVEGDTTPPSGVFTQVSAGGYHTCGIRPGGTVECWGAGKIKSIYSPDFGQSIPPAGKFKQISAYADHTCGIRADNTVVCWGTMEGEYGENVVQLSTGQSFVCGILADRTLTCSGTDTLLTGKFTQVSAGYDHICAVKAAGLWFCWGDNTYGQIYPYTISGTAGKPDVLLRYPDGISKTAKTNAGGKYSFGVPDGWSGTVTPSKKDHTFTPVNRSYSTVSSNQIQQNYKISTSVNFASIGSQDGTLLESSENSNLGGGIINSIGTTYSLGDDASNRQYRAILSFNTASIPDTATISSVTLFMSRSTIVGTNPFNIFGKLRIDIRIGSFGTSELLEAKDFHANASATNVGNNFTNSPIQSFTSLNASGLSKINKLGLTQLRLYFTQDDNNNLTADYQDFLSGNHGSMEVRPFLKITYTMP